MTLRQEAYAMIDSLPDDDSVRFFIDMIRRFNVVTKKTEEISGKQSSFSEKRQAFLHMEELKKKYPGLRYHIKSGDTLQVTEKLDRGLYDFAVIVEPPDLSKYNYLTIPEPDTWGLPIRKDHPLAEKRVIHLDDLYGIPLFCSEQAEKADLPKWCGEKVDELNIAGTFTLTYNASIFVREGLGALLTFDKLADTSESSELCFRPIEPALETWMYIIWKKYQVFTPIAERLLQRLKEELGVVFERR